MIAYCLLLLHLAFAAPPTLRVVKVYDGDTFTLSNGEKVRLQYVNAPEMEPEQPFAAIARSAAAEFLWSGAIHLTSRGPTHDSFGRRLAEVHVDNRDLSVHLLERGLAHVYLIPPIKTDLAPLYAAQERARQANLGIWTVVGYQGALHITSFHANAPGDDLQNVNGETLRLCNITNGNVLLSNYRLRDSSGATWPLPALELPPGYTVKIHSGQGTTRGSPDTAYVAYLGSAVPIWNNRRETVEVIGADNQIHDRWFHATSSDAP